MRRWKKIGIGLTGLILTVFLVVFCYFLSLSFTINNSDLQSALSNANLSGEVGYYHFGEDSLRYVNIGNDNDDLPLLLMIHGAPGSCGDFSNYWHSPLLLREFKLLAIDRPGYDQGNLNSEDVTIVDQAEIIEGLIKKIGQGRKVALVSHSYGGPVGALIARNLDTLCLGHVMVAPVIDPNSEKIFWYSSIPISWPFSLVSSRSWKIAAKEKLSHRRQLQDFVPEWNKIESPTIHIHGMKDWLASPENLDFCQSYFKKEKYQPIILGSGSHFILWSEIDLIIKEILRLDE